MLAVIAGVAALVILLVLLFSGNSETTAQAAAKNLSLSAVTAEDRINFLKQFGWEVKVEPVEVTEVLIPREFDEVYEQYNEVQKNQNMDLSACKGKRVKRWTYEVNNYPGVRAGVRANILVLDGKVIGGDVSSAETGGFMHGFAAQNTATGADSTSKISSALQTAGDVDDDIIDDDIIDDDDLGDTGDDNLGDDDLGDDDIIGDDDIVGDGDIVTDDNEGNPETGDNWWA